MDPATQESPRSERVRSRRALLLTGVGFVLLGLLANPWLLALAFSPDGVIDDPADLLLIGLFELVLLVWGFANIVFRNTELAAKINLLLVTLCILSPLVGEVGLRVLIAAGVESVRNPGLYADPLSDDDYWKLDYLWLHEQRKPNPTVTDHEILGWAPRKHPENPLGIIAEKPYTPDFDERAILFYGDSFVAGATQLHENIPQQLDQIVERCPVHNFGVAGYGVDQIYLRFKNSHTDFAKPFVIFGILTSDIDRCLLSIRGRAKPYFVLRGNLLELQGVPVNPRMDEWIDANPLQMRSFLAAFGLTRLRLHQPGDWRELPYRRDEKKSLNAKILSEMIAHARLHNLPFLIVLFYDSDEMAAAGWRELFLRDQFDRAGVEYLDTKTTLLEAARREASEVSEYFRPDHHLNGRGNRIVAEAIASRLQKRDACHSAAAR